MTSFDESESGIGMGITGIAPNIRLLAVNFPQQEDLQQQMYTWIAGFDVKSATPSFPEMIQPVPISFLVPMVSDKAEFFPRLQSNLMKWLARRGRHGKGCLMFFSAGNHGFEISMSNPYGTSEHTFSCAASTLNEQNEEVRADYSGYSNYGHIEWCAPSSTSSGESCQDNRPESYGVWAAYPNRLGNLPSFPVLQTTATKQPRKGDLSISVETTKGMFSGIHLLIGNSDQTQEVAQIASNFDPNCFDVPLNQELKKDHDFSEANKTKIDSGTCLVSTILKDLEKGESALELESVADIATLLDLLILTGTHSFLIGAPEAKLKDREELQIVSILGENTEITFSPPVSQIHPAGSQIALVSNGHKNNFGGTSSSTPLCAGIAALVLSANPMLTWVEVRQILRTTANKIDTDNVRFPWLDNTGIPANQSGRQPYYSNGLGYGRLDAGHAVEAAIAYSFPRDLMIRNHLHDAGDCNTVSVADSPDIWVRTMPPHLDGGAIPENYSTPGPNMNPNSEQNCWIYVRIRNRGNQASLDASVRVYVASHQSRDFIFPEDWECSNGIGNTSPTTWAPATYLIGEVNLPAISGDSDMTVSLPWSSTLIPPKLTPQESPWSPRLLVEITPLDGPLAGKTLEDNNNLAEKAIEITYN